MTENEHLLKCVEEECAEVAQRVSKALRFGVNETQSGHDKDNAQRIRDELNDLLAAVEMCCERGLIPPPCTADFNARQHKRRKILKYLEYARTVGTLV